MNIDILQRAYLADPTNHELANRLFVAYLRKNTRIPPIMQLYLDFVEETPWGDQLQLVRVDEVDFDTEFISYSPLKEKLSHPVDAFINPKNNIFLKIILDPIGFEGQYPYRVINAQQFYRTYDDEHYVQSSDPLILLSEDLIPPRHTIYFDGEEAGSHTAIYVSINIKNKKLAEDLWKVIYASGFYGRFMEDQFDYQWPSIRDDFVEALQAEHSNEELEINETQEGDRALKKLFLETLKNGNGLIFLQQDEDEPFVTITADYPSMASYVELSYLSQIPGVSYDDDYSYDDEHDYDF